MNAAVDYRTRDRPMLHAERVSDLERDGERFTEGVAIAYDISVSEPRTCNQHTERREGIIVELWIEDWHGQPLPYAEVDQTDGEEARVWFHRDHVSTSVGFLIGQQPEGALF